MLITRLSLGFYGIPGIFKESPQDLPFLTLAHTDALVQLCLLLLFHSQHCARMLEEATGTIAVIPQLPKHPAEDTDPLVWELDAKRKVGERYFEPAAHLSPLEIKYSRSQGADN